MVFWPLILTIYLIFVSLALTFDNSPAQFFLGLPWMVLVAMLSSLIGHAGGVDALSNSQLICYGINALILLFLCLRRIVTPAEE